MQVKNTDPHFYNLFIHSMQTKFVKVITTFDF